MAGLKRPNNRLLSAVPYVRQGAVVADVGTDHAYLPIFLLQQEIASRAVACDIAEGPIRRARENIAASGLTDRMDTLLTDGLHGVEPFCPDHVILFGMGGELIVKILSEAPWVRSPDVRLILQPMSRAEILRAYLWENGFGTVGETLTRDDGRIYQTICSEWRGETIPFTQTDCLIGKPQDNGASPLYEAFLKQKIQTQINILRGRSMSKQADLSADETILHALEERLREIGGNG